MSMSSAEDGPAEAAGPFDDIAEDLGLLREAAGPMSYGELVRRITEIRLARGIPAAAAIPARSTVYNMFMHGRRRMDAELIRDIVLALGSDEAEAERWVERSRAAGSQRSQRLASATPTASAASTPDPIGLPIMHHGGVQIRVALLISALAIALNFLGEALVLALSLPIYLDMLGTALAALVLGPWWGVGVAAMSALVALPLSGQEVAPFVLVTVTGALVWGYGVRTLRMGDTIFRYVLLNLLVAVATSAVAVPLVLFLFAGGNGHGAEVIAERVTHDGVPPAVAVALANLSTSVMDKLLCGFLALTTFVILHGRYAVPAAHMPVVVRLTSERQRSTPQMESGPYDDPR